ncbi:MAG: glycoside hydrolase, partial [Actinomycetota bacterium]|nr:glycoside hydrolase [Actinomycetota bacterium]
MISHSTLRRRAIAVACSAIALALVALPTLPTAEADADGSGGSAVVHKSGARKISAKGRKVPDAKLYRTGYAAGEPTLGIDKEGTVYFTTINLLSPANNPGAKNDPDVLKSADEGKSWENVSPKLGPLNAHQVSLDPYIWLDRPTGRIFNIDLTVACSLLSYSDDGGKSWVTNPLACGQPVNDHQTLFGGPPVSSPTIGYPHILYYCWNDIASSSCSKSLDGGLTFHRTGAPAYPGVDPAAGSQGAGFCGGLHGHGYVGPDGTVYLPKGHCGAPMLSISKDEGKTWTRVRVADITIEQHEASVAADKKGNLYYLFIRKEDRMPYLVISKDGGETWAKPIMVGAPGLTQANLPTLDMSSPGKVAVAYLGSTYAPRGPVFPCSSHPDYAMTTWNGYITMTT